MGTTLSFTFPLGRFHATRWGGGANTSDVEWPPSPWRILRALIATWYSRWPELPSTDLDRIIEALGAPNAYLTPPTRPGSTRHYMPDLTHTTAESGNTDQVLDSFLAVPPQSPLLVHWVRDLVGDDRATLAKLVELMPYLGRSESVCVAALCDGAPVPDATWWRMGESGPRVRTAELLAPDGPTQRRLLEATTVDTRRAGRPIPIGARRVTYGTSAVELLPAARRLRMKSPDTGFRYELSSTVPVRAANAILATDALHGLLAGVLANGGLGDEAAALVGVTEAGKPRSGVHDHLHVIAVPERAGDAQLMAARTPIVAMILWSPTPMSPSASALVHGANPVLRTRQYLGDEMSDQRLLAAGSGQINDVAPELIGPSRTWTSAMPYLAVRHRKRRHTDVSFLDEDIRFECRYRSMPEPREIELLDGKETLREVAQYRRRRTSERLDRQRRGYSIRLVFSEPIAGPILLGQLSHFGFGLFAPC